MNRWEIHVEKWTDCKRCDLHTGRQNVVLARGSIPADVVLCGEAPGETEDITASPFSGPAGHLMDQILDETLIPTQIRYVLINLVGCIPRNEDGSKTEEPPDQSIVICGQRVIEMIDICKPKLIVCVGKLAEHWLDTKYMKRIRVREDIPRVSIMHPAGILRAPYAVQPLSIKRCIITLQTAIRSLQQKG